jgi:DHA1 family multidrug resistance protein-like MFS transporter
MKLVHDRGQAFLVVSVRFMTSIGFFLVVPFLIIYLTAHLRMSVAEAGLLFAVLTLTRRGLGLPAGWVSDHFGARQALVIGLLGEAGAYSGFAVSKSFWLWLLAVSLLGAGGSLTNMGARSLLATAPGQNPALTFSRYYVMINAAALIGPLLGAALIAENLVWVTFTAAATLHATLAGVAWIVLRASPTAASSTRASSTASSPRPAPAGALSAALRDRTLLIYCGLTVGCWFFDAQYYVALPLAVEHQRLPAALLGPLNAGNAVVVMIAVWFLGRWVSRQNSLRRLDILALSAVVLGAGWLLCIFGGLAPIAAALFVVSLGEALFMAVVDVIVATLAPPGSTGIYLGFSSMAWAVGGVVGSLTGSAFGVAARHDLLVGYWALFALIGLATGALVWSGRRMIAAVINHRALAQLERSAAVTHPVPAADVPGT